MLFTQIKKNICWFIPSWHLTVAISSPTGQLTTCLFIQVTVIIINASLAKKEKALMQVYYVSTQDKTWNFHLVMPYYGTVYFWRIFNTWCEWETILYKIYALTLLILRRHKWCIWILYWCPELLINKICEDKTWEWMFKFDYLWKAIPKDNSLSIWFFFKKVKTLTKTMGGYHYKASLVRKLYNSFDTMYDF